MHLHKPALLRTSVVAATAAAAAFFTLAPAAPHGDPATAVAPALAAPVEATPATATPAAGVSTAPVVEAAVQNVALARPAGVAPAAVRAAAVQNALAQLGKPYRYGATGPRAFDCSGLTSFAFKAAGITLPRTSRAQSTIGVPVARADLQAGDLVFFYRPVSHVAIYIGNGLVVHASTSGQPVKISPLSSMPFSGARRV